MHTAANRVMKTEESNPKLQELVESSLLSLRMLKRFLGQDTELLDDRWANSKIAHLLTYLEKQMREVSPHHDWDTIQLWSLSVLGIHKIVHSQKYLVELPEGRLELLNAHALTILPELYSRKLVQSGN